MKDMIKYLCLYLFLCSFFIKKSAMQIVPHDFCIACCTTAILRPAIHT